MNNGKYNYILNSNMIIRNIISIIIAIIVYIILSALNITFIASFSTAIFTYFEISFLIKVYMLTKSESLNSPNVEDIKIILLNSEPNEKDSLPIKKLKWMLGRQSSYDEIKTTFQEMVYHSNEELTSLLNLAPSVGLISTFFGMALTLFIMFKNQNNGNLTNLDIISGLWPVYIPSLLGMIVYAVGTNRKSKISSKIGIICNQLVTTFLEIDREYLSTDPKEIKKTYLKLLKPVTALFNKLQDVNTCYTQYIENFSLENKIRDEQVHSIQNSIDKFLSSFSESFSKINDVSSNNISLISDKIQEYVLILSNNVNSIINKQNEIIENNSKNISNFYEILNNSTSKVLETNNSCISNLVNLSGKVNGLIERMVQYQDRFENTIQSLSDFSDKTGKLFESIKPIDSLLVQFTGIAKQISDEIQQIQVQIKEFNSIKNNLEQYNSTLLNFNSGLVSYQQKTTEFLGKFPPDRIVQISNGIDSVAKHLENINAKSDDNYSNKSALLNKINDEMLEILQSFKSLESNIVSMNKYHTNKKESVTQGQKQQDPTLSDVSTGKNNNPTRDQQFEKGKAPVFVRIINSIWSIFGKK